MILVCLVSSNASNETMIPSLGSPRAPFAGPPSIVVSSPQWALAGINWVLDVLQDIVITTVVCHFDSMLHSRRSSATGGGVVGEQLTLIKGGGVVVFLIRG
jgi:hypothetical protein